MNLRDKRNQLFKSYDALTERIFAFERECERFKQQKRQMAVEQQKVNVAIQERYAQIEAREQQMLASRRGSPGRIPLESKESLRKRYEQVQSQIAVMSGIMDRMGQVVEDNKQYIQAKDTLKGTDMMQFSPSKLKFEREESKHPFL